MKQPDLCDVCKRNPVTKGGFLLNCNLNGLLTFSIAQADAGYSAGGFKMVVCGQDCLVRHINAEVARLIEHGDTKKHNIIDRPWHASYKGGAA